MHRLSLGSNMVSNSVMWVCMQVLACSNLFMFGVTVFSLHSAVAVSGMSRELTTSFVRKH